MDILENCTFCGIKTPTKHAFQGLSKKVFCYMSNSKFQKRKQLNEFHGWCACTPHLFHRWQMNKCFIADLLPPTPVNMTWHDVLWTGRGYGSTNWQTEEHFDPHKITNPSYMVLWFWKSSFVIRTAT